MPYVPNAEETTQPTGDKSVASAAPEFRALKQFVADINLSMDGFATELAAILAGIGAGDNSAALAAALAASGGSSLVGFLQAGTGAVFQTQQAKDRQIISPLDFGAVGNGIVDDTAAFQLAIAAGISTYIALDLAGRDYAITTVNVPNGKDVSVCNGRVTVIGSGFGFSKVTLAVAAPARCISFYNVHFVRTVAAGACVYINLAWQDTSGSVIVDPSCSFALTNGAYGVRLARSFGNVINGIFTMDATSVGIMCDASEVVSGDTAPSCPFETIIDDAFFIGGIAFSYLLISGSQWNSFEGFSFGPGCRFYASILNAKKYNSLKFTSVQGVSWKATFDSGNNTSIVGGYFDRITPGDWIFKFLTTLRDMQGVAIGGGVTISAQGTVGDLIVFSDAGTAVAKQITNVVFGTMYLVGGLNNVATPIRGIKFDHQAMRNFNMDGAQSFQNMYSCLTFTQAINRSVIKAFDARDITFYAENVATGYGPTSGTSYNRFDGIYRVYNLNMLVPTYIASGAIEPVSIENYSFENMMRPPIAAVSSIVSPFGAGFFTIDVNQTYRNGAEVRLIKNVAAPGGTRGGASAIITLDASTYIAPL